jgi:enterochelin esterase-like enzyme
MAKIHERVRILLSKKKLQKILLAFFTTLILCVIVSEYGDDLFTAGQHLYFRFTQPTVPTHHMSHVDVLTFPSKVLKNKDREVRVYVPEEYDKNPQQKFPTLYLLHGSPGSNQDWLINTHIAHTIDTMIDNNELKPMIVVFPDGNGPTVKDSQYVDASLVDQDMGRHIAVELVDQIDQRYRTIQNRQSRAIGGASSGGYGAANLAIHYPERFGIVISMSGYFRNHEYVVGKLFGSDLLSLAANNPMDELKNVTLPPNTFFFLQIGNKDNPPWLLEQNEFRDELLKQKVFAVVEITEGGHGWGEWQKNISSALRFLNLHITYGQ